MTAMETSVSITDSTIYQHLFAAKEQFRQQNRHRHWSEEQLKLEWTRLLSTTGAGLGPATTGGYTPEIPRTMPSWTGRSFGPSTDTTSDGNQAYDMNRDQGLSTQSAPVMAHSMSRTPSSRAVAKRSYSTFAAPGNPPATIARWQNEPDVPFSNYTISTQAGNARKRSRPMPTVVDATEHNPEEWIQAHSDSNLPLPPTRPVFNNTYPALAQQDPTHLTVSIPTPATYLDRPFTESPVPSTPVSDLTDASTMSTQMSRGLSTVSALSTSSSSLPRAMNDMHLSAPTFSDFSSSDFDFKPLTQENLNTASLQYPTQLQSSKSCEINGGAVQSSLVDFSSSAHSATISSESTLSASHTAQPMKREDSSSSALSSSSRSNQSRSTRRRFEQLQNAKTPIAPKVDVTQHDAAPQMKRIISTDGSTKEVAQIPRKQPVQRQQRDKLYCPYCNDHTEGFRGEHELQRHTNRAHSRTRKVWICVDVKRSNPSFLSQCKACREGKRYGAYYNAAAQ